MDWNRYGPTIARNLLIMIVGIALVPRAACSQEVTSDVRQKAQEAFHGPDLKGKDGPLAKVGVDLALLYYEHQVYQEQESAAPFQPHGVRATVADGYVVVDALAAGETQALQADLEALGMKGTARAGRVVSGRLPIEAIPEMAKLSTLRAAHPARPLTFSKSGADTTGGLSGGAMNTLWYMTAAIAIVVIGGAAAVLLNRTRER